MVWMPMGIKTGLDILNLGTIQLLLNLFRRVNQYIRAVNKQTGTCACVGDAQFARLLAHTTVTQGPWRGDGPTGAEKLNFHGWPSFLFNAALSIFAQETRFGYRAANDAYQVALGLDAPCRSGLR
jgi:hypothetical protein